MSNILPQVLGYLAFIFLAISLLVNNDIKFRWINSLGAISFVFYGLFIGAFPIVLTNAVLFAINIFFLIRIYRKQEKFDLVEFTSNAALIPKFLSFYTKDIAAYFPKFNLEETDDEIKFVVLRDVVVANIFVAAVDKDGNAFVKINYTVPKYRDYKVGRFLFDEGKSFLIDKGIKNIVYTEVSNQKHLNFLRVMGFQKKIMDNQPCYIKNI
ncbi:MAG: YgjV family protein [Chitinophagaceae bacterium]|nr:YgjV family protein [Chitinophagaceae bacterium]